MYASTLPRSNWLRRASIRLAWYRHMPASSSYFYAYNISFANEFLIYSTFIVRMRLSISIIVSMMTVLFCRKLWMLSAVGLVIGSWKCQLKSVIIHIGSCSVSYQYSEGHDVISHETQCKDLGVVIKFLQEVRTMNEASWVVPWLTQTNPTWRRPPALILEKISITPLWINKYICNKFNGKMHHGHAEMTTWPKVEIGS